MESPKEYTITIRDTSFILFDDQIHRDAPNYFTNYFEDSFRESQAGVRAMRLNRDPYLFAFVHTYLCGYDVLPLPDTNIPSHLSKESRLKNLLADARFFGLDSFVEELNAAIRPIEGTWKILYVFAFFIELHWLLHLLLYQLP